MKKESIKLFCFPYAGGNKYSYQELSKLSTPHIEIATIELPGHGSRFEEKLLDNVELIVEDLVFQLQGKIDQPYAFYGHSMGALMGYLTTRRIINMGGIAPLYLFFSGRGGPSIRKTEKIRHLMEREQFLLELQELGGIPRGVLENPELINFFEPIIRNDFKAIETFAYKESEKLTIPITILIGIEEKVSLEDAKAWQKETEAKIEVIQFPGNHFFINNYNSEIFEIISDRLRKYMIEDKLVYLKPNVVIEPLFDRWYAWPHLISPTTAGMNITGRHLKIMNSYIQAPKIHAAAIKNPKMLGGPFIDYNGQRVEDIKALRDRTLIRQEKLIALSNAIKELDKMLRSQAKGYSLEPLYEKVPEILKGYVELVYDLNNNPSFRFFESLLYKSDFYNASSQSIALWLTNNDERPFVLSTPRLDLENVLHLDIPFASSVIDSLSKMKRNPSSLKGIKTLLSIEKEDEQLFESFFTIESPTSYKKYDGDKIRMRYFGHACILIETKDISILVDPLISYYGYHSNIEHFSDIDLPETLDYILITHNHQDHILFETLLPLRHKTKNIIVPRCSGGVLQDPSIKLMFNNIGFKNVLEIDEMESLNFTDCSITGVPFIGEHGDLDIKSKICYHVKIADFKIMFVADSCILEPVLYKHVFKQLGEIDVIFLGMECEGAPLSWLYGPLLTEELPRDKDITRRFSGSNYERGMSLINIFNPKETYVYAMGQEPWVEFISSLKFTEESNPIIASNKLINECSLRGQIAERLYGEKELLYQKIK